MRKNFKPCISQTTFEDLTHAFFGSCSSACIFQYAELPFQQIPVEADVNVESEVEVGMEALPPTIPELIKQGCTSWEFCDSQVIAAECLTRGQSANKDWHNQKAGRITAANMHAVLTKVRHMLSIAPKTLDCSSLLLRLCTPSGNDFDHVAAIKYGRAMESEARKRYIQLGKKNGHKKLEVQECGLFIVKEHGYMGASPDGLVNCECCGQGLLEIKCPLTLAHVNPTANPPPYIITEDGHQTLKKGHPYYSQVIAQMGATERKWCDFFVYSRHGSLTVRIPFDEPLWRDLVAACETFFVNHIIDYIKQM